MVKLINLIGIGTNQLTSLTLVATSSDASTILRNGNVRSRNVQPAQAKLGICPQFQLRSGGNGEAKTSRGRLDFGRWRIG